MLRIKNFCVILQHQITRTNLKIKIMKTTLNQKMTLVELNSKSDNGMFSHKILRTKLIAESHYNPSKHTKGKFYFEDGMLWCAYVDLKNKPCYVPMFKTPSINEN